MQFIIGVLVFFSLLLPSAAQAEDLRGLVVEFIFAEQIYPHKQLDGYILYKDNVLVCSSVSSDIEPIVCDVLTDPGTFDFTLTAHYTDDSESPPSPAYAYTLEEIYVEPVVAVMSCDKAEGDLPLDVLCIGNFSTGPIESYDWYFGEGEHLSGSSAGHTYNDAGTFTITFQVVGQANTDTITTNITVNNPPPPRHVLAIGTLGDGTVNLTPFQETYVEGSTVDLLAVAASGWHFTGWSGDLVGTTNPTTITMDFTKNIVANFVLDTYIVTPLVGTSGSLSPSVPQTINSGDTTSFVVTPDINYHINTVTGCDGTLVDNIFTTGPIITNCAITASFDINTYTVTPSAETNGSISPSTDQTISYGTTTAFTITPNIGYNIDTVSGCEGTLLGNTYTTGPVTTDCLVTASFVKIIFSYDLNVAVTGSGQVTPNSGTYTEGTQVQLTATPDSGWNFTGWSGDLSGTTNPATISMSSDKNITAVFIKDLPPIEPPSGFIYTSSTVGDSPLTVDFDGSASTTTNPPMLSYSWDFGDGDNASGETVTHTFDDPGTFYTELTVVDTANLTDSVTTPIIVTEPVIPNEKPFASIEVSLSDTPLTALFSGAGSYDVDGNITSYVWDLGDGNSSNSIDFVHTYDLANTYTVSLTVTDDKGDTNIANTTVTIEEPEVEDIMYEVGSVELTDEWVRIIFTDTFTDPVVIAGPPSYNDIDPVTIRIRNITATGFDMRLQEWDYMDVTHGAETVSYIVIDKGVYVSNNGLKMEVGTVAATERLKTLTLQQTYDKPIVLTQIITNNDSNTLITRLKAVTQTTFAYKLQEQRNIKKQNCDDIVGYLVIDQSSGELSGLPFETSVVSVTNGTEKMWNPINYTTYFNTAPIIIASIQTNAGREPSALRVKDLTNNSSTIMIEKEYSLNKKIRTKTERVGYLIIGNINYR